MYSSFVLPQEEVPGYEARSTAFCWISFPRCACLVSGHAVKVTLIATSIHYCRWEAKDKPPQSSKVFGQKWWEAASEDPQRFSCKKPLERRGPQTWCPGGRPGHHWGQHTERPKKVCRRNDWQMVDVRGLSYVGETHWGHWRCRSQGFRRLHPRGSANLDTLNVHFLSLELFCIFVCIWPSFAALLSPVS